jgi:hypothetical protein
MHHLPPGLNKMSQFLLTALFAITLSFLTFAASFEEVPRSEFVPLVTQQ